MTPSALPDDRSAGRPGTPEVLDGVLRVLITSEQTPDLIAEITAQAAADLALACGTRGSPRPHLEA